MSGDPCERGEACYQHRNYSKEELIEAADAAASKAYIGGYAEGVRDGVKAARDAVVTAIGYTRADYEALRQRFLAAIDGVTTRGEGRNTG